VALFQLSTAFPQSTGLRFLTQEGQRFECGFGANTLHVFAAGDYYLLDETGRTVFVSTGIVGLPFNIGCLVGIPNASLRLDSGQTLEVISSVPG
jgi:hypothetical protein